jgi:phospholipase C
MSFSRFASRSSRYLRLGLAFLTAFNYALVGPLVGAANAATATPIQHVIVIIGENRTFDHIFATYVPKVAGETVDNLLSKTSSTLTVLRGRIIHIRSS